MHDTCYCWKCGAELTDLLLPLARLAECPACRAELHVCRMCKFYDPNVSQQCREPVADLVADKTRANFCGYFTLDPNAGPARPEQEAGSASRRQLDALFGEDASGDDPADATHDAEDAAREELDRLFRNE